MSDENQNKNNFYFLGDDENSQDLEQDQESGIVNLNEEGFGDESSLGDNQDDNLDDDVEKNSFEKEEQDDDLRGKVVLDKQKVILIKRLLENIQDNNKKIIDLLSSFSLDDEENKIHISQIADNLKSQIDEDEERDEESGRIVEGVFDGQNMIGPDGKQYTVPANYASKSKMVEGDMLKLIITDNGTFIYKQIGPIDRMRVSGILEKREDGSFVVNSNGKRWKILPASVTYFKGRPGDEVVLLVPKNSDSSWGAVENIINNAY